MVTIQQAEVSLRMKSSIINSLFLKTFERTNNHCVFIYIIYIFKISILLKGE